MKNELSKFVVPNEDKEMLEKANEIAKLFRDAATLGFSITFSPEDLKTLIPICENAYLYRPEKKEN